MALGTTSSRASCTRLSSPTVMLDMVVGRVVVPSDLPVGSVILTRNWTMSAPGGQAIAVLPAPTALRRRSCRRGPRTLEIKSTPPTCRIGMRFSRGGATVNIVYPDVFSSGYMTPPTIPSKGRALRWNYQNRGNHRRRHRGGG